MCVELESVSPEQNVNLNSESVAWSRTSTQQASRRVDISIQQGRGTDQHPLSQLG